MFLFLYLGNGRPVFDERMVVLCIPAYVCGVPLASQCSINSQQREKGNT